MASASERTERLRNTRYVLAFAGIGISIWAWYKSSREIAVWGGSVVATLATLSQMALDKLQRPRRLPSAYVTELEVSLGVGRHGRAYVHHDGDSDESLNLYWDVRSALLGAGFDVGGTSRLNPSSESGIRIEFHSQKGGEIAEKIARVFRTAGLPCRLAKGADRDELFTMLVGRKP